MYFLFVIQNEGFAVRIDPGSSIILQDSCFLDNYFLGDGIVILNETANAIIGNNYVDDGMMSDLICSFAMKEESGECIQPDSDSCSLLGLPPKSSPEQASTANNNNSTNPVLNFLSIKFGDNFSFTDDFKTLKPPSKPKSIPPQPKGLSKPNLDSDPSQAHSQLLLPVPESVFFTAWVGKRDQQNAV